MGIEAGASGAATARQIGSAKIASP